MATSDVTFDGQAEFETPKTKAERIYKEIYNSSLTMRAYGWLTGKDLDIKHIEENITGLGVRGDEALACIKTYKLGKITSQTIITGAVLGGFWYLKKRMGL